MARVFSGVPQPVESLLSDLDGAVSRFPFDPSLRAARRMVLRRMVEEGKLE